MATSILTSAPSTSQGISCTLYFGDCKISNTDKFIQYKIYSKQSFSTFESISYNYETITSSDIFTAYINTILPNAGDPLKNDNYVVSTYKLSTNNFTVSNSTYTKKYGEYILVGGVVTVTPNITTLDEKYDTGYFVFTNNKVINVSTANPELYYYITYTYNYYYGFGYTSTIIPTNEDTVDMCEYPSVEGLLFKSRISVGYNSRSYYDGILYEARTYIDGVGDTITARCWSYSYAHKVSGRHIAEIYTDSYTIIKGHNKIKYTYFYVIPYVHTRFQYPATIDRIVKCVDVNSYFSNDNGSSYVQNGSIIMASSESKAGTTEIFNSLSEYCVLYGSPAYLQVSIVPSTTGNNDENYITKVNIHAYEGGKFQGTITMDATKYNTYKYNYTQKENAYTFTFDVVTRQPQLKIIKKSSDKIPGVSWTFTGGALSKTLVTDNNGEATYSINNSKSEYAAIKVTSLTIPEAYKYKRPSSITFISNDFSTETCSFTTDGSGNDYRNFSYTIGGSSIQQYNYDITAYAVFADTEHLTTYVTAYGGAWYLNVPDFSVSLRTCGSNVTQYNYVSSYSGSHFVNASYITSLEISKTITLLPAAAGYAYIGNVIVSKAKEDGSDKTELTSFTSDPKSTEYITVVSEDTMLNTTYVTYVDVEVCAYHYPVCFAASTVGNYSVNVNNQTFNVSEFDKAQTITPITYIESINLKWATPVNTTYELDNYNLYAYIYGNTDHTGSYTYELIPTKFYANTNYKLIDIVTDYNDTLNPYELFVISPVFKVTPEPSDVIITAKAVSGKEYDMGIDGTFKHIGSSDSTVATIKENGSTTIGTIKPTARQYSWNSDGGKIEYINSDGTTETTYNVIKENTTITKPDDFSGTLSQVVITPAFNTKTTFNIAFERYKTTGGEYATTPNYSSIKWFDNYNLSGDVSVNKEINGIVLDTLLPYGDTFGIESITLDDENYKITKIQSTTNKGTTWVDRKLGKSNAWLITGDTTVMPIIEQTVKDMQLKFLPVTASDYTVVYSIDGTEQSPLNINSKSSGVSTVTFKSSSKIVFKSITFASVEYSIDKITINNTNYDLNNEYTFFNPSANYYEVKVTEKSDYSKIEYKLNVNAQSWTDNISEHFKYDVILSDSYFNLKTDTLPNGADSINAYYVSIDSSKYNNVNTMTLPVTYVGTGIPTSPNVDIMFYVDNNTYDYKVKLSGYSPYTATYTSSGDYNWTVPVSKAFELNSQKQISYIVQVAATKYNFRGSLVPYDIKNQTSITSGIVPFGVLKGVKTTYTLTDPSTIGVSPENYGIMVSNAQIEVSSDTWQTCKYKLALSPTVIPVNKSYTTLNICNNNSFERPIYKVSVKVNGSNAFDNKNNEVALAYLAKIGIPYKLNNPNSTTFSINITSYLSRKFSLSYNESGKDYFVTSSYDGSLEYSFTISANASISKEYSTFFINYIS